jgi:hypothetical protein
VVADRHVDVRLTVHEYRGLQALAQGKPLADVVRLCVLDAVAEAGILTDEIPNVPDTVPERRR